MTLGPVHLDLSDDQLLLRETTVRFIETELPPERVRDLHADRRGFEPKWLRRAAEIGWFAMLVGESDGGGSVSGRGLVDAAVVAEEIGRGLQPGPFVPMNVVAAAIGRVGSEQQRSDLLAPLIAGESVAAWAFADAQGNWDGGAGVEIARSGPSSLVVSGARGFVQDAGAADWLLVPGQLDGAPAQVLIPAGAPGVAIGELDCLDLGRRMGDVELRGVTVPASSVLGDPSIAAADLELELEQAVVLNCADTVGAADALLSMTVAYARDRIAFGRPIGSFQAIKHILADQALHLETCKAGVEAAALAVSDGDTKAAEIVSMVASYIGEMGNEIAQQCLQVHGGIGYTWEHDLHLYLRRIRTNSALYGEPAWHRERICRINGLGAGAPAAIEENRP